MSGAGEDGGATEDGAPPSAEGRRKGLGGSMSLRTRKLGRRLSRSMSIVALKLPEKAQNLTRSSSKLMKSSGRDKKNRSFELSIILPDKSQKQVTVWSNNTVAEAVSECLLEIGAVLAGTPSAPVTAPLAVSLAGPLPAPPSASFIAPSASTAVLLFMGGSRAPVDARAPAAALEGEVLVLEYEPPPWDGKDLEVFITWEKIYASTLFSAVELYGKPLARAAAISKEEYHLLFYYLQSVSEASEALAERMRKYIDSGLLINEGRKQDKEKQLIYCDKSPSEEESKSILSELVLEGVLSQRDVDAASVLTGSECTARSHLPLAHRDSDTSSSVVSALAPVRRTPPLTPPEISLDCGESILDGSTLDDDGGSVAPATGNGHCCIDHRISADVTENVWANMSWNFLNPNDFGYDQIRSVKRSRSDSALTPVTGRRNEDLYERLPGVDGESCGSITPYESIEDLYDCIKNGQYSSAAAEESTPSTESRSEPRFPDYSDKTSVALHSSTGSDKSALSSVFPLSKCDSSDSASATAFCESTSGTFAAKITAEALQARALPQPPIVEDGAASESTILLRQLFMGELMDAYAEFLAAYPHARALLRRKLRRDEHFAALADIRRGAAKLHIADYLELPIERLAQYERLVGGGGCGRRRAVRLSDLERVQDLFPHDYLALHDADAPAALATHHAQKTKSLRKRPSLDLGVAVNTKINANSPRTFIMEAPVQLCPLGAAGPPLDRHLFLFSDLLLVGKSRGTNCFKLKESVRVAELWLSMPDGDDTSFLLGWPTTVGVANYLATYPTQAARDSWFRKIQTALNTQLVSEPKSTNIQVFFKDPTNSLEFCKTVSVGPELSVRCVVRQALHVLQTSRTEGDSPEGDENSLGAVSEFVLCMRATRDAPPTPLHGIERPHAIQMSRIRQTLSNEDGFDMEHVNAKNNPCGLVFELRKKNQGLKNGTSTPGRGLRLLRRGGRLFGVSLTRLCGGAAPPALLFTLRRLRALAPHTHGVFRRSANAKALRLLRDKLDALGPWAEPCTELERAPVLLLAALVKEFFRALPQPLLSADLYPLWLQVLSMPQTEKLTTVRSLLLKLPKANYTMLTYFICLLQAIAKKSNVNLMCPTNLAVCVGPSLLWPLSPCDKAPKAIPLVVEFLIIKAEALFGPQIAGLLGNGSPESSNALLDSGAEESDSLHSVGISLDSMELSSPRKEKLSLSRDSGLTLSEDDSNSNGGNSPAPRNILHSLSAPTCVNLQQETKHITRYGTESHNVNGLPPIKQCQNIYANKAEIYSSVNEDLYTAPYRPERYVHNSINVGITNGEERIYGSKQAIQRSQNTYEQSPAKYITGLEPQKPPRSLSKAARTSKVYSMFGGTQEIEKNSQNKNFSRAKSSDNLLEVKKDVIDNKRDLVSSQENILYNNIHDLTVFTENLQRQRDQYQHTGVLTNSNYSRVYTGWEKKSANYAAKVEVEKIYGHNNNKQREKHNEPEAKFTAAATIFTRNDWTRQAARTKSLEANEDNHNNGTETNRQRPPNETNGSGCRKRRFDPAHLCGKACSQPVTDNIRTPPMQPSYSYGDDTRNENDDSKKSRLRNGNGRLNQSKSLANIVVQSDSSSCDTLYQQGSLNGRSSESPASERGYTTQYIEPLYTSVYNRRRDIFHESERPPMFSSDIYKATPTAVQPDYRDENKNDCENRPQHLPPPVPPRKMVYQRILKKFPPVHANKDDKSARSKSVPPVYRDPPTGQVLALDCSDTDTESESYV